MEKKDLMIGDWVQYTQNYYTEEKGIWSEVHYGRVCSVGLLYVKVDWGNVAIEPEVVKPIPLTAEILEKNGFEICNEDSDGAIQYEWGSTALGIDIWINTKPCLLGAWRTWAGKTKSYTIVEELPINFVHELQHALRLCGIEKEITI